VQLDPQQADQQDQPAAVDHHGQQDHGGGDEQLVDHAGMMAVRRSPSMTWRNIRVGRAVAKARLAT
jgi:hypothetical protein